MKPNHSAWLGPVSNIHPIFVCAAVRLTLRCFVPPVSANRLGFLRHLQSSSGWSNAIQPGSQHAQCPLRTEVKGSTLEPCRNI